MTTQKQVERGLSLPVMEHFYTIQGEGMNSGTAAYFIRLGGCDVGCVWCDVKKSWSFTNHPIHSIEEIIGWTEKYPVSQAVITGGEPTLYDLTNLTKQLRKRKIKTFIETSGTNELTGQWDWVCFSPKKFKPPVASIYRQADELKVIVVNKHDLKWAQKHAEKVSEKCALLLQPEWEKQEKVLPMVIEFVKNNPKWKISLQTHKFMAIP